MLKIASDKSALCFLLFAFAFIPPTGIAQTNSLNIFDIEAKNISTNSATISFKTDSPAKIQIYYGTNSNFLSKTAKYSSRFRQGVSSQQLSRLKPSTLYYYQISVRPKSRRARRFRTEIFQFMTLGDATSLSTTTTLPTTTSSTTPQNTFCDATSLESRVNTLLSSPDLMGFGANTTGGASASDITWVTNLNDSGAGSLREALQKSPVWIAFDESLKGGTIVVKNTLYPKKDTTIDGRGASGPLNITLAHGNNADYNIMNVFARGDVQNLIIEGMRFDGRNRDRISGFMGRTGKYYWLDHVTITGMGNDDAISIGMEGDPNTATNVTISNYHVHNTSKGLLTVMPETKVSLFKSHLAARDRVPYVTRHSKVHVFNNYSHSYHWGGNGSAYGGYANIENNVVSGNLSNNKKGVFASKAWTQEKYEENKHWAPLDVLLPGNTFERNNLHLNGATPSGPFNDSPVFEIPYQYELMDTTMVVDYVLANSGSENAPGVCR